MLLSGENLTERFPQKNCQMPTTKQLPVLCLADSTKTTVSILESRLSVPNAWLEIALCL